MTFTALQKLAENKYLLLFPLDANYMNVFSEIDENEATTCLKIVLKIAMVTMEFW